MTHLPREYKSFSLPYIEMERMGGCYMIRIRERGWDWERELETSRNCMVYFIVHKMHIDIMLALLYIEKLVVPYLNRTSIICGPFLSIGIFVFISPEPPY